MNIITKKITLRLFVLTLSVLALTFTLIGCPTEAVGSSGDSSSSNNNNSNNSNEPVCDETIKVVSQDVGLYHILLNICTDKDINEIGFAVTTSATAEPKADITGKLGYITRKFTKGVTRPVLLTIKADKTKTLNTTTGVITVPDGSDADSNPDVYTLAFANDALAPNTQYYVHLYHDTTGITRIDFTTATYYTTQNTATAPGEGVYLSPPNGMTYEFKIAEPFILTFYVAKFDSGASIYFNGSLGSTCDRENSCSSASRINGYWVFGSGGDTLAHTMGYVYAIVSGSDENRLPDSKTEGTISTRKVNLPEYVMNYKVVTE